MSHRRRVRSSAPFAFRRSRVPTLLLAAALALVPFATGAQEPAAEAPQMSEETAARMAAWAQAMTPGPQHEMLAGMAGDWSCEITMWMEPGTEPMVEQFTATRRMVFGGRFLEEDVAGTFMGQPFNGRAITGYDNVTGMWWNSWIDDHTTRMMVGEGTWDGEASTWTFLYTNVDPLTGEESEGRGVTRILSADHEVHEMWEVRDGESVKTMEMVYRRR
jgi:hypothetical protein